MIVTREEFINSRMNLLKDMDKMVREVALTYTVLDMWLMCGVPDGADDTDFKEIAEDNELWLDCVHTFAKVMKLSK